MKYYSQLSCVSNQEKGYVSFFIVTRTSLKFLQNTSFKISMKVILIDVTWIQLLSTEIQKLKLKTLRNPLLVRVPWIRMSTWRKYVIPIPEPLQKLYFGRYCNLLLCQNIHQLKIHQCHYSVRKRSKLHDFGQF